jgi:hypothetical protein
MRMRSTTTLAALAPSRSRCPRMRRCDLCSCDLRAMRAKHRGSAQHARSSACDVCASREGNGGVERTDGRRLRPRRLVPEGYANRKRQGNRRTVARRHPHAAKLSNLLHFGLCARLLNNEQPEDGTGALTNGYHAPSHSHGNLRAGQGVGLVGPAQDPSREDCRGVALPKLEAAVRVGNVVGRLRGWKSLL